jgi:hypothetical protein
MITFRNIPKSIDILIFGHPKAPKKYNGITKNLMILKS